MTDQEKLKLIKKRAKFVNIFAWINLIFMYAGGIGIVINFFENQLVKNSDMISVAINYFVYRYMAWGYSKDLEEIELLERQKKDDGN
jgi:hypothetical protein